MVNQVDKDSFDFNLLECIFDHQESRDALSSDAGWNFQILWNDGNKEWVPLKEIKKSNPIELTEYVRAKRLHMEPMFQHWVPTILQQREVIVSKVKARTVTSHKYGVEIPRTVLQAYRLDEKNGDSVWRKAIEKEMMNVGIAFHL